MRKLPKAIKKAIILDIILIVIFNAVMLLVFTKIDLLEWLYDYSQKFESLELDEVIPLFFILSVSLLIFIIRRFIEQRKLFFEVEQLSIRDHLTGLYNRRFMQDMFYAEIERVKRGSMQFSVLIIDIDDFKNINDSHGHNTGDKVLSQFSEVIQSIIRKVDIVSRWGGEEFLILCPETNINEATLTANRLITAISEYEFHEVGHATVSIGVVITNVNETFEVVVNRADECLYKAKNKGKNCYVSA
jgi:diguanylate cyclase (GGDEF)-like protein